MSRSFPLKLRIAATPNNSMSSQMTNQKHIADSHNFLHKSFLLCSFATNPHFTVLACTSSQPGIICKTEGDYSVARNNILDTDGKHCVVTHLLSLGV